LEGLFGRVELELELAEPQFSQKPPAGAANGATCSMRLLPELAAQLELEPHRTAPKPVQQL